MQLAQPRRQLVGADRHQDEVVRAHLGIQPGDPAHLDAEEDARGDQLGPLAQAPDRVATDFQVLARLDEHDVDRPPDLGEVVADDIDRVTEPAQHRSGGVLLQFVPLGVERDDEGS